MASTHEIIVSTIRTTATAVNPTGRFIYGDDVFQTQDYPDASKASDVDPKALISLFTFDWSSPKESDSDFNTATLSMGFLRSADVANTPVEVEAIINQMSELAEAFETALIAAVVPVQFTISAVTYGQTRGVLQGYYTGVLARFTFSALKSC
jgi:hypothetical protein